MEAERGGDESAVAFQLPAACCERSFHSVVQKQKDAETTTTAPQFYTLFERAKSSSSETSQQMSTSSYR